MKSRFKIFRVVGIIALAIISPALPYGMITGTTLNLTDRLLWSVFFGILVLLTLIYIWSLLLNRLVEIELRGDNLYFKNLITRAERQIEVSEIEHIKYSKWTDTLSFITPNKKFKVMTENYKNLDSLVEKIKNVAQQSI